MAAKRIAFDQEARESILRGVKKGDEVIFASYAGTELKIDGEELMIMSEDDILAIVE
jgi:chaperonin GroES